jgi:uncharacterized protein YjbI with pentapeptide repeats
MNILSRKIFATAVTAALLCLLTVGTAGAYDQADMDKLLATNACSFCNLTGADLSFAVLLRANLVGANLSGAYLGEADFSGATWTNGRQCAEGSIGGCM